MQGKATYSVSLKTESTENLLNMHPHFQPPPWNSDTQQQLHLDAARGAECLEGWNCVPSGF